MGCRTIVGFMTDPDAPEADVAEQRMPVDDEDDWEQTPVTIGTDQEASEADLIEQAIAVPLPDDEP